VNYNVSRRVVALSFG